MQEGKKRGLFALIRETSFTRFIIGWVVLIILFGFIYWLLPVDMKVTGMPIEMNFLGLFSGLYASLLIAVIVGLGAVAHVGFATILVYVQLAISGALLLILADKIVMKYMHPHYSLLQHHDRKVNTLMIMMSMFRHDAERLMHEYTSKSKEISIKEIESIIDGLYVVFVDVEKMFSDKNVHRQNIKTMHYFMIAQNIQDSLEKLGKFITFMDKHKIEWRDESTKFWIGYILDTADNIVHNLDTTHIKNPKAIIAIENIREYTQQIRAKI